MTDLTTATKATETAAENFNNAVNAMLEEVRDFTEKKIVDEQVDPLVVILGQALALAETCYIVSVQRQCDRAEFDSMFEAIFKDMKERADSLHNNKVGAEEFAPEGENA